MIGFVLVGVGDECELVYYGFVVCGGYVWCDEFECDDECVGCECELFEGLWWV